MTPQRHTRIRQILDRRQPDLTVVMDNVNKPHNLAAIVRTCDAVGVMEAHAVAQQQSIRMTQKAAGGSGKWVRVNTHSDVESVYASLRKRGFRILVTNLASDASGFRDVDYTLPTAVVLGAELVGVSSDAVRFADQSISIPTFGMVDSLNVSVAAALILFEAQRQREAAGLYARPQLQDEAYRRLLFEYGYPRVAAHCRRLGHAYPAIDADGSIIGELPSVYG